MGGLKPALFFAAGGLVLSFLVGLISSVDILSVLLRSVIAAVVCGGFCFLAQMLLKDKLPELFETTDAPPTNDSPKGQNVDIMLGDDEDEEPPAFAATPYTEAEQPHALSTTTTEDTGTEPAAAVSKDTPATESAEPLSEPAQNRSEPEVLDQLPNLDAFATSFDDSSGEITSDLVDAGSDVVTRNQNDGINSENVQNMAKAIQTVLKKDAT